MIQLKRGRYWEDFAVGMVFQHPWGRTITDGDNSLFTTMTMMMNPLYLNRETARAAGHPDTVVNPLLVMNIVFGMSVEDLSERAIAHLAYNRMRFGQPVYPGDTLRSESEVLGVRPSESKTDRGVLHVRTTGRNQCDQMVLEYERKVLIRRRPHE